MTISHKKAVLSTIVWVLASAVFLFAAFSGDGPATLEDDSPRRNIAGAATASGLFLHFLIRFFSRQRNDDPRTLVDERDKGIDSKATELALGVTVAGVFLGCIALYDAYQAVGAVPVNWVWFLGYSGFIFSHLGWAVTSVAMYAGVGARAQG